MASPLPQHDLVVSGIDWSPVHDKIVTCSHDRNAFVWTLDAATDKWAPTIAILRLERAALDVKWSPDGALGSDTLPASPKPRMGLCADGGGGGGAGGLPCWRPAHVAAVRNLPAQWAGEASWVWVACVRFFVFHRPEVCGG